MRWGQLFLNSTFRDIDELLMLSTSPEWRRVLLRKSLAMDAEDNRRAWTQVLMGPLWALNGPPHGLSIGLPLGPQYASLFGVKIGRHKHAFLSALGAVGHLFREN